MNLNISRDWLLRMADREANGIISVGGLVARIREMETTALDDALTELARAYEHQQAVLRRGHSDYIRENGRRGGSPWSELMDAVRRVLDERAARMGEEEEGGRG